MSDSPIGVAPELAEVRQPGLGRSISHGIPKGTSFLVTAGLEHTRSSMPNVGDEAPRRRCVAPVQMQGLGFDEQATAGCRGRVGASSAQSLPLSAVARPSQRDVVGVGEQRPLPPAFAPISGRRRPSPCCVAVDDLAQGLCATPDSALTHRLEAQAPPRPARPGGDVPALPGRRASTPGRGGRWPGAGAAGRPGWPAGTAGSGNAPSPTWRSSRAAGSSAEPLSVAVWVAHRRPGRRWPPGAPSWWWSQPSSAPSLALLVRRRVPQ